LRVGYSFLLTDGSILSSQSLPSRTYTPMFQRLKADERLLGNREVSHVMEESSTCKILVALHQAAQRKTVKHIHTNTGDAYCITGTVQISAVGDR
jgi:hypothetical protein